MSLSIIAPISMVNNCKYLKIQTHTCTLLTCIFFGHEVAYVAPSNLVRSRSRGIRKETKDDIILCKQRSNVLLHFSIHSYV